MMKCLCDAYEKELDESATLIRNALGYDSQTKDVWDRRILLDLIRLNEEQKQELQYARMHATRMESIVWSDRLLIKQAEQILRASIDCKIKLYNEAKDLWLFLYGEYEHKFDAECKNERKR